MVTTDITLTVVVIVMMMNVPEAHKSSQRLYKAYDTLYEVKAALLRFPRPEIVYEVKFFLCPQARHLKAVN